VPLVTSKTDADDPLRTFRVSLTRLHEGVKLDGR
jgi:hypothetical protein